jgi:hypothetical protein
VHFEIGSCQFTERADGTESEEKSVLIRQAYGSFEMSVRLRPRHERLAGDSLRFDTWHPHMTSLRGCNADQVQHVSRSRGQCGSHWRRSARDQPDPGTGV